MGLTPRVHGRGDEWQVTSGSRQLHTVSFVPPELRRFSTSSGLLLMVLALLAMAPGCAEVPVRRAGTALQSPSGSPAALAGPIRTVVVDAGHGGNDPGTSHFGLREKFLALDIAKRVRTELQQAGLTVVMTRETDQFIPLSKRPGMANRLQADLFVSVHINANRNARVSGAEVYYPRVSVVSADAQWPPDVRREEVGVPSVTVKQVLWDMVLGRTRSYSRRLASSVCRSVRGGLGIDCRGPKSARFVVLREAWMPSILVEVGYVTNPPEARRLANPAYRQAAAQSIAEGVVSYIRELGAEHI